MGEALASTRSMVCSISQRHDIAAIGIGAGRQRLQLQRVDSRRHRPCAHSGRRPTLRSRVARSGRRLEFAAEAGTGGGQRQLVERALLFVERAVDAVDLFVGDDIGGALFELREPFVIGLLELLEGEQEFVEGRLDLGIGVSGFGFEVHM